jgi:hypothetical protein
MSAAPESAAAGEPRLGAWEFVLRVVRIAVLLALVYCLGERGALFFYQGF